MLLSASILSLSSCATLSSWLPGGPERIPAHLSADKVPHAIEEARAELEHGQAERALEWMRAAAAAKDLDTQTRETVQSLIETAAESRIEQLSVPGSDPELLADMLELDLPRQLAVTAGIRAARMMYEKGERLDAFRLLKKVDTKFPLHHERVAAGELLADIGFALAADDSSFLGLFKKTDDAVEVLEYLTLNDPWTARCDEAYATLARIYEAEGEWNEAIDRNERLLLNHPNSPLRPLAQARVPRLRLRALRSPEYDRGALLSARKEIEDWLRLYPAHALVEEMRIELADCLRRLCDNDLVIARFYDTVDNVYGARRHAGRALEEALQAGDQDRIQSAERTLAGLPPARTGPGASDEGKP